MTVRIGMIGPGGMGQAHIDRIHTVIAGGRVVAVSDVDPARAAEVAERIGGVTFATSAELIESPDVDAVMICSFGPAHEVDVLACIAAGKPVFCEKPLTPTAAAALRIMEAEQAAGRRLVTVGFMRRFDASYRQMKALLDSGDLGETLMVHCAHRNPTVPENYTWDMAINDTAIHEVDTMRWLLGEEFVSARVDTPKKTSLRFPAPPGPARPHPHERLRRPGRRRDLRQLPVRLRHPLRGGRREGRREPRRPERHRRAQRLPRLQLHLP